MTSPRLDGARLTANAFVEWGRRAGLIADSAEDRPVPAVPPRELREITAFEAEGIFLTMGLADAIMFLQTYRRTNGARLHAGSRILDFGCGCGRVARYMTLLDSVECHGADVNPRLVEWCSSNIEGLRTVMSGAQPPLPYDAGLFDFVYALSVFTHLSEESAELWLAELGRILKPGGVLIATVHGYSSLVIRQTSSIHQAASGLDQESTDAILERFEVEQFAFVPYEADVVAKAQAGPLYGTAFIEPRWLREHSIAAGLEIVEYVPVGLRGLQDLVVFSRPAR